MILLWYARENTIIQVNDEMHALNDLYYGAGRIPTEDELKDFMSKLSKTYRPEVIFLKQYESDGNWKQARQDIKISLARINIKIPLYDEYTKNMFLISRDDIYEKVIYHHYRFPDKYMIERFVKEKKSFKNKFPEIAAEDLLLLKTKSMSEFTEMKGEKYKKKILEIRYYKKLHLMIQFLKNFNIDTLYQTYQTTFYEYSNKVGKNITICVRPSFKTYFTHIPPYYTRSELINLGLNMKLIKPDTKYYDRKSILELCEKIKTNDISNETLLKHQMHIINSKNVGPIQYYSLQGSYFINRYLRSLEKTKYQNKLMENLSTNIWNLILNAPAFDKEYTVYRFIKDDKHMGYLRIGDIYTVKGFLSTTRDPFYNSEEYKFGFILIKIKIPAGKIGTALCMETISHFPKEQEILLAPLTKLKLVQKNETAEFYHTDHAFVSEVTKRYEFEYLENSPVKFEKKLQFDKNKKEVNFLTGFIAENSSLTMNEKVTRFVKEYVTELGYFTTKIGEKKYKINVELYDSTSAYSKFYAKRTQNGFSMYLLINNSISFLIEIGDENSSNKIMYVNYYFRFSSSEVKNEIKTYDFIFFLSTLAYYFSIPKIIIFADYYSCDIKYSSCESSLSQSIKAKKTETEIEFRGGNYCIDFYQYLKHGEKKYKDFDSTELHSNFYYYALDSLKVTDPMRILDRNDRDEIYQIYTKAYMPYYDKRNYNISDFYIWMVNNYCFCLNTMIEKMYRIFPENNPFLNDSYTLNPLLLLYNKKLISSYDSNKDTSSLSNGFLSSQFKNNYRLEEYEKKISKEYSNNRSL